MQIYKSKNNNGTSFQKDRVHRLPRQVLRSDQEITLATHWICLLKSGWQPSSHRGSRGDRHRSEPIQYGLWWRNNCPAQKTPWSRGLFDLSQHGDNSKTFLLIINQSNPWINTKQKTRRSLICFDWEGFLLKAPHWLWKENQKRILFRIQRKGRSNNWKTEQVQTQIDLPGPVRQDS